MDVDFGDMDCMLFRDTTDVVPTDDEVIHDMLSVCWKQTDSKFDKELDEVPTSSPYDKSTRYSLFDEPESPPRSLPALETSNTNTLPEENEAQNTEFVDNIYFDSSLTIPAMRDNEERYRQNVSDTGEFFDNEENDFMLFKELRDDRKFCCLSEQLDSSTCVETIEMIEDAAYNDIDCLLEATHCYTEVSRTEVDTRIKKRQYRNKRKDYMKKSFDNMQNSETIHTESSPDFLEKRYVLLIDASDEEDEDDLSLINFLAFDKSLLVQTDKTEVSSRKTEQLILDSNELYLDKKADKKRCEISHGVNKRKSQEQNLSLINGITSKVKSHALGNLNAETLRLLGKLKFSQYERHLNDEINTPYSCKLSKPLETKFSREANEMGKSSDNYKSQMTSTNSKSIQNELFSSNRKPPQVLKWINDQKVRKNVEDRNYWVNNKCAYSKRDLSKWNYEFPLHSPHEHTTHDIGAKLQMDANTASLYCKSSIPVIRKATNDKRLKNGQDSRMTRPHVYTRKLSKDDSALKGFSIEKRFQDKKMQCMKSKSLGELSFDRLSSYKNHRHMIAVQSTNFAETMVSHCTTTQKCDSKLSVKSFERQNEIDDHKRILKSIKKISFHCSKNVNISHKPEGIEKCSRTTLKRLGKEEVSEINLKHSSSTSKLQQISKKQKDEGPTLETDREIEVETVIDLIEIDDDFTNGSNKLADIKPEIESDDENHGSNNDDVLHFMLLKEMWDNRSPNLRQSESGEFNILEENEVLMALLEEFLTKRNCDKYIQQLTGIERFLKERNINLVSNSLEDNIDSQEEECFLKSDQVLKELSLSNSPTKTTVNSDKCYEQIIEPVPSLKKGGGIELNEESFNKEGNRSITEVPISENDTKTTKRDNKWRTEESLPVLEELREFNTSDLLPFVLETNKERSRDRADEKISDKVDKQNITASFEITSTIRRYECDENSRYKMSLIDGKQMNNHSTINKGQCSSNACTFIKSQRLEHLNDPIFQPFVKIDLMNLQDPADKKRQIKSPVVESTNLTNPRKHTGRTGVLKTIRNRRQNSQSNRRTSSRIANQVNHNKNVIHETRRSLEAKRKILITANRKNRSPNIQLKNVKINQVRIYKADEITPNRKCASRPMKVQTTGTEVMNSSVTQTPSLRKIDKSPESLPKLNEPLKPLEIIHEIRKNITPSINDIYRNDTPKLRSNFSKSKEYNINGHRCLQLRVNAEEMISEKLHDNTQTKGARQKLSPVIAGNTSNENVKENKISNSDSKRLKSNRLIDKLGSVRKTLNKRRKTDVGSSKVMTKYEQASSSDILIAQGDSEAKDHDSCQSIPIKGRRVKTPLRHSINDKLGYNDSISKRTRSRFLTTAKTTFESSIKSTSQHSPESFPIKRKRGRPRRHNSISQELKNERHSQTKDIQQSKDDYDSRKKYIRKAFESCVTEKLGRISRGILKKGVKLSNCEKQVESINEMTGNGKNIQIPSNTSAPTKSLLNTRSKDKKTTLLDKDYKVLPPEKDVKMPMKSNKVIAISRQNIALEIRQRPTDNIRNELYQLYFTNFLTSNGHRVKFQYVNRRLAVLSATISNVDEAENFVKTFARFDCANYILWRDPNLERYILHRTWLCGINGPQDPKVLYRNLSCQARIHISIKQPSDNDYNAHVLIYMEHTHETSEKKN